MKLKIKSEWQHLRNAIDKLDATLVTSDFPLPSQDMCQFLIVGEDRRFYYHPGVDPISLCRAVWKTYFCGSLQGASTIAMQIVRTITGRYEKTWQRKMLEIILAVRLTRHIPKNRLPIVYLWIAYYGAGMNNFKQACSRLHLDPRSVDSFEAAKLVARLKYPEPRKYDAERLRKITLRGLHILALSNRQKERRWFYGAVRNGTI